MSARAPAWLLPAALAGVLTASSLAAPVLIDEAIYLRYAREFAAHPGDPYGFDVFWYAAPQPAFEVTVPPVIPYWLGLWTSLAGEEVGLAGALLCTALLLAFSLAALLRRVAPGLANPLLVLALLSPSVWPSFNGMLDAPVLALSLAAVASFLAACERDDLRLALAAGVLSGLAMQTKYSGVLSLGVIGVQTLIAGRWRLGAAAAAAAASIAVGWEVFTAARYGESHFMASVRYVEEVFLTGQILRWNVGFVSLLGALFPAVGLLAAAALGLSTRLIALAAAVVLGAFVAIPALPAWEVSEPAAFLPELTLARGVYAIFVVLGAGVAATWIALALGQAWGLARRSIRDPLDGLLLAWLAIELVGFYALSPFLAARRVIGLGVAATLLAGRVLARRGDAAARGQTKALAALSAAIATLYVGGMIADARARDRLAHTLPELEREYTCGTLYFAAHWGFQHTAEALGHPLIHADSAVVPGDCIAIVAGAPRPAVRLRRDALERLRVVGASSSWPWSPVPAYFAGPIPLRAQPRWQARLTLDRVIQPDVFAPPRDE